MGLGWPAPARVTQAPQLSSSTRVRTTEHGWAPSPLASRSVRRSWTRTQAGGGPEAPGGGGADRRDHRVDHTVELIGRALHVADHEAPVVGAGTEGVLEGPVAEVLPGLVADGRLQPGERDVALSAGLARRAEERMGRSVHQRAMSEWSSTGVAGCRHQGREPSRATRIDRFPRRCRPRRRTRHDPAS